MDIIKLKTVYWNYYLELEKLFFETSIYCEIARENNNSFSMKYLQLHLSICSEIDTISKTFCKKLDSKLELTSCGIHDYIKIFNKYYPTFSKEIVKLNYYDYDTIRPWRSINVSDVQHVPNWWQYYNKFKHHRDSITNSKPNYKYANQKNVIEALAALYVLIEYFIANSIINKSDRVNNNMIYFKSNNLTLTNWNFYSFYMHESNLFFDCKKYFDYIEKEAHND